MLFNKFIIYIKFLYLNTRDLQQIKSELIKKNCYIKIISKKELLSYGVPVGIFTGFIFWNNNSANDLKEVNLFKEELLDCLKKFECIQVLGVIENNVLDYRTDRKIDQFFIFNIIFTLLAQKACITKSYLKVFYQNRYKKDYK